MRLAWVCSRSQGHSARSVRTSSWKRATSPATGVGERRDPQRREVVGLDGAVEVVPRDRAHRLVGQPEALEHDDLGAVVEGELDVGQHVGLVALADQQRPALAGRLGGEAAAVDQPGAEGDRVDGRGAPTPGRGTTAPGSTSTVDRGRRRRSSSTARSATTGDPGTAYSTSPCSAAAATSASTMAA